MNFKPMKHSHGYDTSQNLNVVNLKKEVYTNKSNITIFE